MELQSVHDIFTDKILRIPSYQRGYTWSNSKVIEDASKFNQVKGQLKDLWDDLINIPENGWHYLGLLTLAEINELSFSWLDEHKQYAIVDGQQRITSIIILLSILIKKAQKQEVKLGKLQGIAEHKYLYVSESSLKAAVFGYEKDNPSEKYFRKFILEFDEVQDDSKESTYTENLKNAKIFFEVMVEDYIGNDAKRIKELYSTITTNLRFNQYILPKELDEYVVFETMNNRGKPLSELEKLKNRLMYLNSKISMTPEDIESATGNQKLLMAQKDKLEDAINKSWITIYASLGANKTKSLNDEDFLKNHWIMYFGKYDRSEKVPYSQFLFDNHFTLSNLYSKKINAEIINEYVLSLQKSSISWNKIYHLTAFTEEESVFKNALSSLNRAGLRPSFRPLLLAILLREDKREFISLIRLLEEYSFKIFHISDRQSNTGDSKLYRLAYQVYQNKKSPKNTLEEVNGHLRYYYKFSLFQSQVDELFDYGKKGGFYNWSGRFYFLFEYDNYLRQTNNTSTAATEIHWNDFNGKNTIEHIFPQSAALSIEEYCKGKKITEEKKKKYFQIQENWAGFSSYTTEEKRRFCHSLGNLLAISRSDNASFSNDPFSHKVDQKNKGDEYKNRGYIHDSMSAQIVAKEPTWTPETIVKRGVEMINFLWEKLHPNEKDILTEKDKLRLLGLGFLVKEEQPV